MGIAEANDDKKVYSLVIMWAYFILYVLLFVIVSVVCAIDVHKQKDPKANICKLIKAWVISLWRKKKIYGELIPHFFDQATDFGVVYEFGVLYYEYRDVPEEEGIGINVTYLFYLSISIIIAHRVVSAVAVYNLTHNPKYAIAQLFDILMIQCVYTNYKLETNKPSNAQRYLQTMEAIFESAPQILIQTAYLIKTDESDISLTVMASLFTSLFSLSARVSADDKVMLQEEWQEPLRRDADTNKLLFPFFCNIKYAIRVVLWRFLEISSRITLLVLTWVNLGGKAIFFLLFIEFCYLSVLAWGLGTIDIMGNLIYLMVANSKRKGYKWAVPMAWLFWAWRILSGWALLITVTIYAAGNVKYGSDVLNNEAGGTRYDQTFTNAAGLVLFIYSWCATPLWQWVGAVVIFDYKNLASVGRDVDTLLEDGKFDQVLELISFGASYNPVIVLQKIDRQMSLRGVSKDVATLEMEEKKESEGPRTVDLTAQPRNCPGAHGLNEFKTTNDGFRCDICGSKFRKNDVMYGCRNCNYDVCPKCNGQKGTMKIVQCTKGHDMRKKATGYAGGYICNGCRNSSSAKIAWHCDDCQYDLCDKCYNKHATGSKTLKGRTKSVESATAHLPPIDRLAVICRARVAQEQEEENTKWAKAVKAFEVICSCGTFLIVIALGLFAVAGYNYSSDADPDFYLTIVPIVIAAIFLCCGTSCLFDIFGKCNDCIKGDNLEREKSVKAAKVNCPGKHGLVKFRTEQDGFGCDVCGKKVSGGTNLYGCRKCNYDACLECKPEIKVEVKRKRTRKGDEDETVSCPKKHPLFLTKKKELNDCAKCGKQQQSKSWYCKEPECEYHLCNECFATEQQSFGQNVISWMKNRDVGSDLDDKPILYYGLMVWAMLIGLVFFFGSDIAALNVIEDFSCNISGGSEYVSFNVREFLLYGAIVHLSLLGVIVCSGCCGMATDSETFLYSAMCSVCCGFCFCISWIVVGFLLHSEMTKDNVADYEQCQRMVHSWTIIKVIEFGGIPFLMCCGVGCMEAYDDPDDAIRAIGYVCGGGCAFLCALGFFLGSDIAVLVIHSNINCDNALLESAQYFSPDTFMYVGAIGHLSALVLAVCVALSEREIAIGCYFCCSCLFFITWAVFGFLLWGQMDKSTADNKMCSDALISWSVIKILEFIVAPACAGGLAMM